jgi:hypothetical protein
MATKAEWFRYNTERSGPKKAKAVPKIGRDQRPVGHNESVHAGKQAAYALEEAPGGRPSRLSTRKSANRQRTDGQSRSKQLIQESRQAERPRASGR